MVCVPGIQEGQGAIQFLSSFEVRDSVIALCETLSFGAHFVASSTMQISLSVRS